MSHAFFEGTNFEALLRKEVQAPFKPKVVGPKDIRNFDRDVTEERAIDSYEASGMSSGRNKYEGFTYNPQ